MSKRGVLLSKHPKRAALFLALAICMLTIASAAQTLTGTVTNGTTRKPAAGDDVILINLSNGMEEAAKTKADASGKFSFKLTDGEGPHLVRAIHQGVTYHQMAPPGTNSVEMQVYDVARKISEIALTADVTRVQADSGALQGTRLFAVDNTSSPPKTQMNDHNFEFYLPPGAKLESTQAKAPNGQPIAAEATPQAVKNRYAIQFPLRPGETQFQIEYTMPYNGSATLDPKPLYPAQHVVVVLPKTMQFKAADGVQFQSMQDPNQSESVVEVAQGTQAGQSLGFTVSGTGTISDTPSQTASGAARGQGNDNRPGGGLGAPIDAPDPLQKYRWQILVGIAIILALGGWVVMRRQPATAGGVNLASVPEPVPVPTRASAAKAVSQSATSPVAPAATLPPNNSSMLLQALKEEIFQLEVEKKTGKITAAEYDKAKAALDQTLERALKRQG
jgi:hypothetical protein